MDLGTDASYEYTGLTYKMHDFDFLFGGWGGGAQQKRGYQRGAWPPNEAPGNFIISVVTKRSPNVKRGYKRGAWSPNETPGLVPRLIARIQELRGYKGLDPLHELRVYKSSHEYLFAARDI